MLVQKAKELKEHNIAVNAYAPGLINTAMRKKCLSLEASGCDIDLWSSQSRIRMTKRTVALGLLPETYDSAHIPANDSR